LFQFALCKYFIPSFSFTRVGVFKSRKFSWFGYRLDCISASIVLATSFSAVILREISKNNAGSQTSDSYGSSLTPSLVGLSLSYSLQLCALFQWAIRQSAEVENQLTCVERIHEYGQLKSEGRRRNASPEDPPAPPADWPKEGRIVFENVEMRYRENLPTVLNGLDVKIESGEKIGIVGRTGNLLFHENCIHVSFIFFAVFEFFMSLVSNACVDSQVPASLPCCRCSFVWWNLAAAASSLMASTRRPSGCWIYAPS
jgi:hypothetical protein